MPIQKVDGGWKWGESGKVYASREDAVKQAQAAHSNGYKEDDLTHDQRMLLIRKAHQALKKT